MCCSSCMSLNSVQSFVIENCNRPTIENGLNNVCLHPLSRTLYLFPRPSPQHTCHTSTTPLTTLTSPHFPTSPFTSPTLQHTFLTPSHLPLPFATPSQLFPHLPYLTPPTHLNTLFYTYPTLPHSSTRFFTPTPHFLTPPPFSSPPFSPLFFLEMACNYTCGCGIVVLKYRGNSTSVPFH